MLGHALSYWLIRLLTWPIRWLPYPAIHRIGALLGRCAYYLLPKFRKRALSNLSLATGLNLQEKQRIAIAKASLENLMITCLEYPKLAAEKQIENIASCANPEQAEELMQQGKPVIFFCGHQANWEVLFLEGTRRMPGVAIGRPIKNRRLYNWVLSIREKYGGRIVPPDQAIKEGLRGLKRGAFLGIVGDQGRPDSGFSSPFFGRSAWTSPIAAILAHRTGNPIMVATTRRVQGKYLIHYSDPIWPNREAPLEQEVPRLMHQALALLEASIRETPAEWLWIHNRWKQQTPGRVKRRFRWESLCIILPQDPEMWDRIAPHLGVFRTLYPLEFITVFTPRGRGVSLPGAELLFYEALSDLEVEDYRFKLVFNFSGSRKVGHHFKRLSALTVVDLAALRRLGKSRSCADFSTLLREAVCCHAP